MKETMEAEGVNTAATGSPRSIIKEAYRLQMIDDEVGWLAALQARNQAARAYNQDTAMEIVEQTRQTYLPLFRRLKQSIETNWIH